ncbi:ribonuclease H-like domain-containing protein, partial [Sparassis latifolia]
IQDHLRPLAVAANATQSTNAQLDVVVLTIVNLYRIYSNPTTGLDPRVCEAVLNSLEKRWANVDQPIFILAVILNPYLRVSPFTHDSPLRTFHHVWQLMKNAYLRMYRVEPDNEFRTALSQYLNRLGEWSDESMELDARKENARKLKTTVDLLQIWREHVALAEGTSNSEPRAPNGKTGLALLAMRILSMVPNSAPTEETFSQFGITHTKLRNRLDPQKVRKSVILRTDTNARYGAPRKHKHKFGDD